jgi:23S rRNA (uracil1939-C5)-methyltransferase
LPITLTLSHLVYGGDAIGKTPDGMTVFVPFGLPGETVSVEITQQKPGFARARLLEVLAPSAERIQPRCPHFTACGGCQYQHMPYERQLEAKQSIFADQLKRLARLENPKVLPIQPSPQTWNYRNALQFHLSPAGKLGFQAASSHRVVEISECHLPLPEIDALWKQIEFEPGMPIERVELRKGTDGEILMEIESAQPDLPELNLDASISVVHTSPVGTTILAGDDFIHQQVRGRNFIVSAGSFFQVNTPQAEAIVSEVLSLLPLKPPSMVMDLYSGVGLFSVFLAPLVKKLVAIESAPFACDDFAENLDEFDNVELYTGTAEQILPALDMKPDVVVINPPRAGLAPAVTDALLRMQPSQIIYVSCDPATLARDIRRMIQDGYEFVQSHPFDMFPQTGHIESISVLQKRG